MRAEISAGGSESPLKRVAQDIYLTPTGRYQARIMAGWRTSPDGTRVRFRPKATFPTRREAEDFRDEVRRQARYRAAGLDAPASERNALTIGDAVIGLMREIRTMNRSDDWQRSQKHFAEIVTAGLGARQTLPLTRDHLVRLVEYVQGHHETRGVLVRHVLNTVATLHRRNDLAPPSRPAVDVPAPHKRILELPDVVRFLKALPARSVERAVCVTLALTGARRREVYRLRVVDVDFSARTVTLQRRKAWRAGMAGPKVVPMVGLLERELRGYAATLPRGLAPESPFFSTSLPGTERRPLVAASLHQRVLAATAAAGFAPPFGAVGWLRNQTGTLLDEMGVDLRVIQRVLGHATMQTTERHYAKGRRAKEQGQALSDLARALSAGPIRGQRGGKKR